METRKLGQSGIDVSVICLGTMTWGEQNSESDAHEQLDHAVAHGVNFIDAAEMYPVPPRPETQGLTETFIGNWLARKGQRDRVVLATKVAGPADWLPWIRDGKLALDRKNIEAAVDASLKRLQTDYIDLYQLHWPDRRTNFFGQLGYKPGKPDMTPIEETLDALSDLVTAGKIRHVGVSNETAWGVAQYLRAHEQQSERPRIVSIQNPYNLLNRSFEVGLAEFSHRDQIGLLAYSPLGFGVLTGKYLDGARPDGARLTLYKRFSRYLGNIPERTTKRYVDIARSAGLDPAQMALAWVNSRPFVTSNIIGATSIDQLAVNIESAELQLGDDIVEQIEAIHSEQPNPCP